MAHDIHFNRDEYDEVDNALLSVTDFVKEHCFDLNKTAVGKCKDLCDYIYDYFEKQKEKDRSIEAEIQRKNGLHQE